MFSTHFCLALLIGYTSAQLTLEACVAELERIALRLTCFEQGLLDETTRDVDRNSLKRTPRRVRHSKFLRLVREFAQSEGLVVTSKSRPYLWVEHATDRDATTGTTELDFCRGPPC
jgi:hypothetical protein